MAVIRYARQHGTKRLWLVRLMGRRPVKVAAVALANKIARMDGAWRAVQRAEAAVGGIGADEEKVATTNWRGMTT
jgi:hypothetical protein